VGKQVVCRFAQRAGAQAIVTPTKVGQMLRGFKLFDEFLQRFQQVPPVAHLFIRREMAIFEQIERDSTLQIGQASGCLECVSSIRADQGKQVWDGCADVFLHFWQDMDFSPVTKGNRREKGGGVGQYADNHGDVCVLRNTQAGIY
jgi:hypothetical protein